MPRYKIEKCEYFDICGNKTEEWYEVFILIKTNVRKYWYFGPIVERWKVVEETLGSTGGSFKVVKRFRKIEDVNLFIRQYEKGMVEKLIRTPCFEGLGS